MKVILTLGVLNISFCLFVRMKQRKRHTATPAARDEETRNPQMSVGTIRRVLLPLCMHVCETLWKGHGCKVVPLVFPPPLHHTITPHCPHALSWCCWWKKGECKLMFPLWVDEFRCVRVIIIFIQWLCFSTLNRFCCTKGTKKHEKEASRGSVFFKLKVVQLLLSQSEHLGSLKSLHAAYFVWKICKPFSTFLVVLCSYWNTCTVLFKNCGMK